MIHAYKVIKDSTTFDISIFDWDLPTDKTLSMPWRAVPVYDDIEWKCTSQWHTMDGEGNNSVECLFFALHVEGAARATCRLSIEGTSFEKVLYKKKHQDEMNDLLILDEIEDYCVDGRCKLICDVEFEISVPWMWMRHSIFESCEHIDPDFDLVVENKCIKVHKQFISFISPVFHAALIHKTKESRTGRLTITDFEYEVVDAAINFCYGRDLIDPSVNIVVGILRFADKYDIKSVINELESLLSMNLTVNTFPQIFQFASDCAKDQLMTHCCSFYRDNDYMINHLQEFRVLPVELVINLLETAYDLDNDFDILRFAREKRIDNVTNHFESILMESVTIETFHPTVRYAWDYSHENLKQKCAEFFTENAEIANFRQLSTIGAMDLCAVATAAAKPRILSYYYTVANIFFTFMFPLLAIAMGIVVTRMF